MDPKICVVGAGYWGKNFVRVLNSLGVLHCICDKNKQRLDEKFGAVDVEKTTNFNDVLQNNEIDAVVIATPSETHHELTKQALNVGKDVLVEKPMSLDLVQARELVEIAERRKRILMVGHLLRYHPAVEKLKDIVDMGLLGDIYYIYSNRLNLGKIRPEENVLWSFAPHDISVILYLIGRMPSNVRCFGGNYIKSSRADTTVTTLEFKPKIKGHIFVSWLHPYKSQELVVIGSKRMAVFKDDADPGDKLKLYREYIDNGIDPEDLSNYDIRVNSSSGEAIKIGYTEPLVRECKHFIECLISREQPKTDGDEGLNVLSVLSSAETSLKNNFSNMRSI